LEEFLEGERVNRDEKAKEILQKMVDKFSDLPVMNSGVAMMKYWLKEADKEFIEIISKGLDEFIKGEADE
jgi:hypothetical protein